MADSKVIIEIISTAKGLKVVAKDTEKLAKKQKKLMGNISKLQPLMKTASSMLEKLNFVNNE